MSEWKEYVLEDLAEILNQKRIPLSSMERATRQGVYPYYGASGVIDYVNDFIFDGEHVLISEDGENLKSRQTPIAFIADGKFWVNNHAHIVRGKKDFLNRLIVYYFQNLDLNPYLTGAVQPKLNKATLTSIAIYLPESEIEQTAITEVLSSIDDKIDLLHHQNKTLEQLAETLFRQWFVEEAEKSWEVKKISDVASINKRTIIKEYPHPSIEYLDTGSITKGSIDSYQNYLVTEAPSRAQRIPIHNDIVYSLVRPIQCHYGLLQEVSPNTVVSTGFCVVSCDKISPYFIYQLLTLDETIEYLDVLAEGSTSAYPSLKPSDIATFEFQLPPADLLNEFHMIVEGIYKKIRSNATQIKTLTQLRDTLLPKLMSGEVRVEIE